MCESRGGRPGLPVPNNPYGLCGRKATLSLNSLSLVRSQELCESRGGRPGLPVPNSPYGLCGRKASLNWSTSIQIQSVLRVLYTAWRTRDKRSQWV